jgi:thiaminase (transcriptional activator TenA)
MSADTVSGGTREPIVLGANTPGLALDLVTRHADRFHRWTALPLLGGIADGSLTRADFAAYLEQDYLYIQYFGRFFTRLAAEADDAHIGFLVTLAAGVYGVEQERQLELEHRFGADFAAATPSAATRDYLALLDSAAGDVGLALVATLPCMYGYRVAARAARVPEGSPYAEWVELYRGDDYLEMVGRHAALLDALAPDPRRAEEVFLAALDCEDAFWSLAR